MCLLCVCVVCVCACVCVCAWMCVCGSVCMHFPSSSHPNAADGIYVCELSVFMCLKGSLADEGILLPQFLHSTS